MFAKEISIVSDAMKSRLIEKRDKHGNEWKEVSIDQLRKRVDFMFKKMLERCGTDSESISLVDMTNMLMLLYLRLQEDVLG